MAFKMLHKWLNPAILIALLLLLAACGPTAPATGIVSAAPAGHAPQPKGTRITLRVGTGDSGEGLKPHQEIIARFEQENPDIQVQVKSVVGGDYYAQLLAEIAAGNAPDIMQVGDDAVPMFVQKGAFVDLGPFVKGQYPLDSQIYLPGVFGPGAWQGKRYLLPKDFSPLAVYYNKKLFDRYAVPYPQDGWTWPDFLEMAQALTQDTDGDGRPDTWGVQLPAAWTTGFEYWVAAAGGELISEDGAHFQGYMDSAAAVAALRFYAELYGKYRVAPPPADMNAFGGGNKEFADGKAAMLIFGRWPESDLRKDPAVDLGLVGMPVGTERANVLFWSGFGIYSGSLNQEAAWRFLRFYAGEQGAEVWKDWGLPTVQSVAESAGLIGDPLEGVWLRELANLKPRAYVFTPHWGETADPALRRALERAILDPRADAATLLKEAARQAQVALDEKR
jgi:multiple sugar transport system substrate-binding protein